MPTPDELDLQSQLRDALREVDRLRFQNRRLTDDLNDAEENTRVYRRLAYRCMQKCEGCETCNPPDNN